MIVRGIIVCTLFVNKSINLLLNINKVYSSLFDYMQKCI